MKKTTLLIAMVAASLLAHSQSPIQPTDTIVGRANHYFYLPYWYDECEFYQRDTIGFRPTTLFQHEMYPTTSFDYLLAEEHYAEQEIAVRGVAVMVPRNPLGNAANPWRGEEKLFLMQGGALHPTLPEYFYPRLMQEVDSVRWDTAAPKLMRLPVNTFATPADSTEYIECYIYEAMFEHPHKVQDTFYIIGTFRSNFIDSMDANYSWVYHYIPTAYLAVWAQAHDCEHCPNGSRIFVGSAERVQNHFNEWIFDNLDQSTNGPFLPIIRTYSLDATPSPATGGTVEGTGRFPEGWTVHMTAVPAEGYTFSHWSDGNTDNPRSVNLSADTTFTATFIPL